MFKNIFNTLLKRILSIYCLLLLSSVAQTINAQGLEILSRNNPIPRSCDCSPFYDDSNFANPQLISGNSLSVGAVYRFPNVFPNNPYGTTVDALIKIVQFSGGASLLEIDVTSSGIPEAFQPRINSTNDNNQSVLFNITFVEGGGNYGDEVVISYFASPYDIDGDSDDTREYAEVSLPDAYFISNNTLLNLTQTTAVVRGEAINTSTAPGGDISTDPRYTFSNYFENKSSLNYRIGKNDGNSDRYYSLDMDSANYQSPNSILVTYPVICGQVKDNSDNPLTGVSINVTGSDGSVQNLTTNSSGNYKAVAAIPEALVNVVYEIREDDPNGYISISDIDGSNDNLITRTINLKSTCGNNFVDGVENPDGWNFDCGDDKLVDIYGNNSNCIESTTIPIPNSNNVYEYVVEIVYRGANPGQTLEFLDAEGTLHTLARTGPFGVSSNIWVFRGLVSGTTSSIIYTDNNNECNLQSVVVYAFRNVGNSASSSGIFQTRSGYNNIESFTVDIPSFSSPRDLVVKVPISELTNDGRYLLVRAESGGITEETIIYGPDTSLPGDNCCLAIPTLILNDVPGDVTEVVITVDTRNNQNGQTIDGQSWVITGGIIADGNCNVDLTIEIDDKIDISCNGESTGELSVSASGGVPPYQYSINGGTPQSSPEFIGLTAGVYSVQLIDSNGNTASVNQTLMEPEALSVVITKENATTGQGCQNGEATAIVGGGTPPYTYLWSASAGNQTTETATNLPAATHVVTITDANGCVLEQGVVIDCSNTCDAIVEVDDVTDVLCTGAATGSTTVSASSAANSSATFTFTWNTTPAQVDSGVTTSTLSGLTAGIYTVSVTIDGSACQPVEQSITIVEPSSVLNVTATATDESGPSTADGTATASVTGGTPPYTYSWTPGGATTEQITGLSAGDYSVTVTDSNGCTAVATTTVNPGSCQNLSVTTTATSATCNGDSDGTATANVTGGSGSFTYSWSPGGETTQTITGLTAGAYVITITDTVTQCTVESTANVNEPNVLTSGIAVSNILCFGEETGSLDLTVTGGTFPYTFLWSNGATTEDINDLPAGTYTVDITDANGCTTSNTASVQQPDAALSITSSVSDATCNGEPSGSVDITVSGGTTPYFYSWSNGSNLEDITDVPAGMYSVTVIDANGCQLIENNIVISEPEALSVVITKENATTGQGCQNGEATAIVGGGTPPYTYLWSASAGNQTTETATNLPAATHVVTITDANGCVLEQGVVIDCSNTCDAIVEVDDVTDVLCTGAATGSTTVSASSAANSSATFTFTWNTTPAQVDSGVTTSTLSGLTAGIYTVSVTIDGSACQPVEQSITIVEPSSVLNVTATATDESGPSTADGTATASVTGGTPPYTYSWTPGGATTEQITGLSAGDYSVTVTDSNGCTAVATTTVNPGSCQNLSVTTTATSATCNGDSDGTATANVTGGSGSFTYSWSPGGETTQTITGLTAGAYVITITDTVTQCTVESTANVNEPNVLTSGIAVSNILCFGEETGSLDLTVTGGTFPYTFLWSNGATTEDINDLPAGTYTVDITDANGCTTSNTASVQQPDAALSITSSVSDATCNGEPSGSVDITVSGGTTPYFYSWSNGSNLEDITDVPAGMYSVTVIDANGCQLIENNIVISEPEALSVVITKENATTGQGCQNGEATAIVGGGTPPYTYLWSASAGNQTTETATNLPAATHVVTITDANGCVLEQGVVIDCSNTCDAIVEVDDVTDVLCTGAATGSTTVSASSAANSSATFTFTWNTTPAQVDSGVTTSTLSGLTAGIYTVSVTIDGSACQPVEQSITIVEPSSVLNVTATATDESGPSTADGTATASVTGGTPPYTYSWTPGGATTEQITGLSAGDYSVTVTDSNGCTAVATTTVNPGSCQNLSVTTTATSATCNGDSDGTATANVTGGSGSFTYSWSPGGETTQTITGLTAGAYVITITDTVTQCTVESTANVNEPNVLTSGIAVSNILCFGEETGSLDLTVTGGTFPYTFLWSNGATTEDINDLPAGTYTVDITDANGCTTSNTASVQQPDAELSGNIISQTNIICNSSLGSVTVDANGGTTPYSFNLNGIFQTNGDFSDLEAGDYVINIIDASGCEFSIPVAIFNNCTYAENDINNTFADTAVDGNVLTNDTDAEGDTQTVTTTTVTTIQGVTVIIDPNTGQYIYLPPSGYVGEDSFEYTVCDDGNPQACDTATVYIEVLPNGGPDNEAPIANADTAETEQDTPVTANVLSNDFDPDGDPIIVTTTTVTTTEGVVVTIDPNTGEYTYTPPPGFTGDDSFEYTICDNGNPALCDTAVVVITVLPDDGNITVANDDAYTTTPGTDIAGNVLDNDSDPEGDDQTVNTTPVVDVDNGTLVLNEDGTFTYTPDDGFTGTDSFVYSVCDDGDPQACDQATVYITVGEQAINTTDAENDINNTFADTAVDGNVLTNDTDAEGDTQTVTTTTVTTIQGVTVIIDPNTGQYIYLPPSGYVGEDSFEYTVCDDGNPQACDTATVYIEVLPNGGPDNEAPIANADTAETEQDTPVTANVLSNDFDPDGDPIIVTTTTVTTTEGVVVTIDPNTGEYTYTPPPGFTGDDSFEYTICDNGNPALCDTAVVVITVLPDDGNITVANDDAYTTTPGTDIAGNVLDNDSDPEGDDQTVNTTPVVDVDNGTLVLNEDGTFTYTPDDGFTGTDSFVYSVCDDGDPQACDQATVYITVGEQAINTTDAENDINNTFADTAVDGNVLTNDTDAEGDTQTVTTTTVTTIQGVTVIIDPNTGQYIYLPPSGYVGEDSFEYTVCDDGNPQACDTATVYIEVLPNGGPDNEAPIANADTAETEQDTPVTANVLSNDFDPDGDPIIVTTTTVTTTEGVVVTIDPNTGEYTYTPPPGFTGDDSFEYTICDNGNPALCDTAVVVITVLPDDGNITVANDDAYTTTPGTDIAGNVLDNDSDPEGDDQTVNTTPVVDVDNGTLVLNEDGTFTYTPDDGFTGTDSFVYSVCDDGDPQACDQATVYITVGEQAINTTDAENDINNTFADTAVDGNVLTNDTDAEGDTQTVTTTTVTTVQGVTVIIDPNTGQYIYLPPSGYVGEDSFEYTVCDDGNPQACDTATVYIEILPKVGPDNEAPIANADTAETEQDTPVTGNVISNDFDPDGDPIIVTTTTVTTTEGVVVTIDPNTGEYTYTPPPGFTGDDSFEYTICDNGNPALCDTAVVVITVLADSGNITVANDDAYNENNCGGIDGSVLDNDTDPEGDTQTVNTVPVDDVDNGTLILNADGTFSYIPNEGYVGTDSFVYSVCDDGDPQACDLATVYITIIDSVAPSIDDCDLTDATIECSGTDNETLAAAWNTANIELLEGCAQDSCDTDLTGQVTSNYDFNNFVATCGLSGFLTVTYTISDDSGNFTTVDVTLTIEDTTPPDVSSCDISDVMLDCTIENAEGIADQWNLDNITELQNCATDACSADPQVIVTSDYDFNNFSSGQLPVVYTVADDCGNETTFELLLTLQNIGVSSTDISLCVASEVESQVFNLFNLLEGNYNTGGTWEVISGDATVINGNFFDPTSIDLIGENASEIITFSYTELNSDCPTYIEASIDVNNECAVLACNLDNLEISIVLTPNGDVFNEFFRVTGLVDCDFTVDVKIVNRWGAIIFESHDYQNNWNAFSHSSSLGSAGQVPSGTYYYIVTLIDSGLDPITGPMYIGTK